MKITWIGHACFKLESSGFSIIIDPYQDNYVPGYEPVRESANLVLCSHQHNDHNAVETIILESAFHHPFDITVLHTYHDDKQGMVRGENKIHIFDDGNVRVAHFGDIGCMLTPEQKDVLKDLDAVMIPIGGTYTISPKQAKEIVEQIEPGIVIPMHYRSQNFGFDVLETVEEYIKHSDKVLVYNECSLEITGDSLKQTIILKPQNS